MDFVIAISYSNYRYLSGRPRIVSKFPLRDKAILDSVTVLPSLRGGRQRQPGLDISGRQHEVGDARHDFRFEAGAVEDAVMADALLHIMHPAMIRNRTAQPMRRLGLAET